MGGRPSLQASRAPITGTGLGASPAISISSNPSCAAKGTSLALIREDKTLFAVEFMPPVESARPLTTASKEVT